MRRNEQVNYQRSEYWYIGSICDSSEMQKNRSEMCCANTE
jgi:hypothetical protein